MDRRLDQVFKVDAGIVFRTLECRNDRLGRGLGRTVCKRRERGIDDINACLNCHKIGHIARTGGVVRVKVNGSLYLFLHRPN